MCMECSNFGRPYLRLDQNQIYEKHDEVMLNILVAKPSAVAADRQPNIVSAGLITSTRILGP